MLSVSDNREAKFDSYTSNLTWDLAGIMEL